MPATTTSRRCASGALTPTYPRHELHNLRQRVQGSLPDILLHELPHHIAQEKEMNQREKVLAIKQALMRLPNFKSRCALCHTKKSRSGFTFHHKRYIPGELTYSNFPNTLSYYQYLEPLIRADPKRFMLLCSDHHQALERALRYNNTTWQRLNRLRRETIRARQDQNFITGIIP